jgi:putative membrane protein (TIGR04086 family)
MKVYLKALGYTASGILGLVLILTVLHYFNLVGDKFVDISKLIISILSVIMGGYIIGRSSDKKGWLEGIKFGAILIVILTLLTLIFSIGFEMKTLVYYFILIFSATIGSMIGINIKGKKKI